MMKLIIFSILLIFRCSLASQDFNFLYSEKGFWILQRSSCCLRSGECIVLRQDTDYKYKLDILEHYGYVSQPIMAIYDAKGNLTAKKSAVFELKDSLVNFFEFIEIGSKLYGRGILTKRYKNDSFHQAWIRYQEFDKVSFEPVINKFYTVYLGIIKIGKTTTFTNIDLRLNTSYKKQNDRYDFKTIFYDRYDSIGLSIQDTTLYCLLRFDILNSKVESFLTKKDYVLNPDYYRWPINHPSVLLKDKINTIGSGSFDTLGNISEPEKNYNVSYNYNLQRIDSFNLKQDLSKHIVFAPYTGCANPFVDSKDTIHQFHYMTFFEKGGGKFERYFGFIHYKIIDSHLIFHKILDDKKLSSSIPRGTNTYRPIENVVSAPNNGLYIVLQLNSIFSQPSGVRVYRLDSKYNIVWKKDYKNDPPISEMWWKNEYSLRAFENEVGGFTMIFEASDTGAYVGIYCLKIDSTGKAIKLEGKDLTKNSITSSEKVANTFSLYPNPSKEFVSLKSEKTIDYSNIILEVYDLLGKKVLSIESDKENRYDLKSLTIGLYLARVIDINGEVLHQERLRIEKE